CCRRLMWANRIVRIVRCWFIKFLRLAIRITTSFFLLLRNHFLELECGFRKLKNGSRIRILKLMFKLVQELRPLWLM
ncbi:hypothetical protein ISN44_As11g020740, partial [Arabidopsis suecica]